MKNFGNLRCEYIRGSDVIRDGMFLEFYETSGSERLLVAEIFYSDQTGKLSVTSFGRSIPLEALEWMVEQAKRELSPLK